MDMEQTTEEVQTPWGIQTVVKWQQTWAPGAWIAPKAEPRENGPLHVIATITTNGKSMWGAQ